MQLLANSFEARAVNKVQCERKALNSTTTETNQARFIVTRWSEVVCLF